MSGPVEQGLDLIYGPNGQLTQMVNDAGVTLLTLNYDPKLGFLEQVSDRFGRHVLYEFGAAAGTAELLAVTPRLAPSASPVTPWPRYRYAYERINGQPHLTQVAVPDPSSGPVPAGTTPARYMSNQIAYDPGVGFVTARTDANGNRRSYAYVAEATTPEGVVPAHTRVTMINVSDPTRVVRFSDRLIAGGVRDGGETDALGNTSLIRYDDPANPNRPTAFINALGQRTDKTYDAFGNVTRTVFPRTARTYAALGEDAVSASKPSSGWLMTLLAYDYSDLLYPAGRLVSTQTGVFSPGRKGLTMPPVLRAYYPAGDANAGRLRFIAGPDSRDSPPEGLGRIPVTTSLTYTPFGNVAEVVVPAPKEMNRDSRSLDTVTYSLAYATERDPLDGYQKTEALGEPIASADPLGHTTRWRWDAAGNCTAVINTVGVRTDYAYDALGNLSDVLYPATGQTDKGRSVTHYDYLYPDGPVAVVTDRDEAGRVVRSVQTLYGREGEVIGLAGDVPNVYLAFDAAYAVTQRTDGSGRRTRWAWDTAGRLRSTTLLGPAPSITILERVTYPYSSNGDQAYDAAGNLIRRINGNRSVTEWKRANDDGRVVAWRVKDATGKVTEQALLTTDPFGRIVRRGDTAGVYEYEYDARNRLTRKSDSYYRPDGKLSAPLSVKYDYYPDGRRRAVQSVRFTYGYTYDAAGRLISCGTALPEGRWPHYGSVEYAYDDANRLTKETVSLDRTAFHLVKEIVTDRGYDSRGGLIALSSDAIDLHDRTVPLSRFTLGYDALRHPARYAATLLESGGSAFLADVSGKAPPTLHYKNYSASYLYTRVGWLRSVSEGNLFTGSFSYDGAGNPLNAAGGASLGYDGRHQLTEAGMAYDAGGALTRYRGIALATDALGRIVRFGAGLIPAEADRPEGTLTGVTKGGGLTCGYRSDGLRAWKEDDKGRRVYFIYEESEDGTGKPLLTFEALKNAVTPEVTAVYFWGAGGLVFERLDHGPYEKVRYEPRLPFDSEYVFPVFDPFGASLYRFDERGILFSDQRISRTGAAQRVGYRTGGVDFERGYSASTDPLSGYNGRSGAYTDGETGLVWIGGSCYDPQMARFLTRAPNYLDPTNALDGLSPYCAPLCIPTFAPRLPCQFPLNLAAP